LEVSIWVLEHEVRRDVGLERLERVGDKEISEAVGQAESDVFY
jgi:hypothetical protein